MSTRGCVAIGTPKAWEGVYNHYDSYPTGLGKDLWDHLKGKDLKDFAKELMKFDDWRNYLKGGICEWCGRKTTQPHTISGQLISAKYNGKLKFGEYPDVACQYHKHDVPSSMVDLHMTHKDADSLFIEWVYVINPQKREFHILCGDYENGCHRLVRTFNLDSSEPDWSTIERV